MCKSGLSSHLHCNKATFELAHSWCNRLKEGGTGIKAGLKRHYQLYDTPELYSTIQSCIQLLKYQYMVGSESIYGRHKTGRISSCIKGVINRTQKSEARTVVYYMVCALSDKFHVLLFTLQEHRKCYDWLQSTMQNSLELISML